MAWKANDGSEFTNRMQMNSKNSSLAAKTPSDSSTTDPSSPKSIESDPHAMQLVDQLKQMGYTGEDVEKAMGDDQSSSDSQPQDDSGRAATQAAPLQIPGM